MLITNFNDLQDNVKEIVVRSLHQLNSSSQKSDETKNTTFQVEGESFERTLRCKLEDKGEGVKEYVFDYVSWG